MSGSNFEAGGSSVLQYTLLYRVFAWVDWEKPQKFHSSLLIARPSSVPGILRHNSKMLPRCRNVKLRDLLCSPPDSSTYKAKILGDANVLVLGVET